jgi:hypothetical protein
MDSRGFWLGLVVECQGRVSSFSLEIGSSDEAVEGAKPWLCIPYAHTQPTGDVPDSNSLHPFHWWHTFESL